VEEGVPVEFPVGSVVTEDLIPHEDWVAVKLPRKSACADGPEHAGSRVEEAKRAARW
jgi:hypothetical protein